MPVTLTLPPGESGSKARRGTLPGRYRVRPSRKREGKVERRSRKLRQLWKKRHDGRRSK